MPRNPFIIGLTGSIAMGKSQTARLFAAEGVSVHDSDAVIQKLYAKGGGAAEAIAASFPESVSQGAVDKPALSARIASDPAALEKLEALVHPLVAADRDAFLAQAAAKGEKIVVLDMPLLFEAGRESGVDAVVVASAPAAIQRQRALARPGMTTEKFEKLLARQLPDVDKRAKAHFVVVTDKGLDHAQAQVRMILAEIQKKLG